MKIITHKALACHVLAVAVEGEINDWAAYIDAVDGVSHEREAQRVIAGGMKLPVSVAGAIFPALDIKRYRE